VHRDAAAGDTQAQPRLDFGSVPVGRRFVWVPVPRLLDAPDPNRPVTDAFGKTRANRW
jgi:hypothetical protein